MSHRWAADLLKKMKKIKKKNIYKWLIICLTLFILDMFGIFNYICEQRFTPYFEYPMHGNIYTYIFNLKHKGRHLTKPLNMDNYKYRIVNKCSINVESALPPLTLLVRSNVDHLDRRMAIRRTWGSEKPFSNVTIRRVFLMGTVPDNRLMTAITKEAEKYNDIIQTEIPDDYFNNTIMGMRRMTQQCINSHYYLLVDDNYYVSVRNVLRYIIDPKGYPRKPKLLERIGVIQEKSGYDQLFAGYVLQTRPTRQKYSKTYVSLQEYPYNRWPPYVRDSAFIISKNALLDLYHTTYYTKRLKKGFLDIYLGISAFRGHLNITHCEYFYDIPPKYIGPKSYSSVIAAKGFKTLEDMVEIWNKCENRTYL